MTLPNTTDLSRFPSSSGKLLVLHSWSNPVFSVDHTIGWFIAAQAPPVGKGVVFWPIPGLVPGSADPTTDQTPS